MSQLTVWIVWAPRTETLSDDLADDFGEELMHASSICWQMNSVHLHESSARVATATHRGWRVEEVEVQQ